MDVWVIETGEYEQRGISGVAISLAAAEAHIKRENPSVERWDALTPVVYPGCCIEEHQLCGYFPERPEEKARRELFHVKVRPGVDYSITKYAVEEQLCQPGQN